MSVGKRLRFEILKRDGFRCRYCGATSMSVALHVDHVIAVANGGTDDPANLVAACAGCNSGKSAVPLDASQLAPDDPMEMAREHVEQMREYLAAQKAIDAQRDEVEAYWCALWSEATGYEPPLSVKWRPVMAQHPPDRIRAAIDAVGAAKWKLRNAESEARYFHGALRRMAIEKP